MKRPRRGVRRFVFASRSRSRRVVVVCTCTRTNVQTYSCSTRQSDVDRRAPLLFRPFPRESSIASRNRGTKAPGFSRRVFSPAPSTARPRARPSLYTRSSATSGARSSRSSLPSSPPLPARLNADHRRSGGRRRRRRSPSPSPPDGGRAARGVVPRGQTLEKLERVPGARSTRDAGRDSERRRVSSAPLRSSRSSGRRRRRR